MERFRGTDALLLHMEGEDTPMHTLKVAVLDTGRRGRPVTLADLRAAVEPRLGLVRRATQRIEAVRGFGGRPFWVDDDRFDLDAHLDERTIDAPGGRAELDRAFAQLASEPLDPTRPLWAMTLLHGLEGGRQAVAVRVHHAVTDGLGALNAFLAATTDVPGQVVAPAPAPHPRRAPRSALRRAALRGGVDLVRGFPALAVQGLVNRRRTAELRADEEVPGVLSVGRTSFNGRSRGPERRCASTSLDLEELRRIGRASGATVNGVLHAVVAGAIRAELLARGEEPVEPAVAAFGIAADPKDVERRWGNLIAPASVYLHVEEADPVVRLERTARSCLRAVAVRREVGVEPALRWMEHGTRLLPALRALFGPRVRRVVNTITTANVAGPRERRWAGDVEIVEWTSFAVAVAPAEVNLTAYSYAGRLTLGLISGPASMASPAAFLARVHDALAELVAAVDGTEDLDAEAVDAVVEVAR